jgi:hypothetical protein
MAARRAATGDPPSRPGEYRSGQGGSKQSLRHPSSAVRAAVTCMATSLFSKSPRLQHAERAAATLRSGIRVDVAMSAFSSAIDNTRIAISQVRAARDSASLRMAFSARRRRIPLNGLIISQYGENIIKEYRSGQCTRVSVVRRVASPTCSAQNPIANLAVRGALKSTNSERPPMKTSRKCGRQKCPTSPPTISLSPSRPSGTKFAVVKAFGGGIRRGAM